MSNYTIESLSGTKQEFKSILSPHTQPEYAENTSTIIKENLDSDNYISIGAYGPDGTLYGFVVGILYNEPKDNSEYKVKHPELVDLPKGDALLLKYGYVDQNRQGQGIGTDLTIDCIRKSVEEHDIDILFSESWIKDKYQSSEELLEKLGFTVHYESDTYYEPEGDNMCDGCDEPLYNCKCTGAIYIHSDPEEI